MLNKTFLLVSFKNDKKILEIYVSELKMGLIKSNFYSYFIIAFLSFVLLSSTLFSFDFVSSQSSGTEVSGIITADTTWTQANSPYTLTGNVLVNKAATLTVEPGVTVDLNGYYIMVNGTLQARGTSNDKITFNGAGSVSFTQASTSWNEQTGFGSIIEYANLESTSISIGPVSPKISSNSILQISVGGSALISHNTILNRITLTSEAESPVISYNTISGEFQVAYRAGSALISHNTINNGITVADSGLTTVSYNTISGEVRITGSPAVISHNTINGKVVVSGSESSGSSATISDNTITGAEIGVSLSGGLVSDSAAIISNNKITARDIGINLSPSMTSSFYGGRSNATIIGNTISGCETAGIMIGDDQTQGGHTPHSNIARIEKNTISNNYYGVKSSYEAQVSIEGNLISNNYYGVWDCTRVQNNTISGNSYGVLMVQSFSYNNIQDSSEYSVHLGSSDLGFFTPGDVDATHNWWGTTDQSLIKASIYDFDRDFTLGKVNFVPFLAGPNPQATPDTFVSTPVDFPSPSPPTSPSPSGSPAVTPTPGQEPAESVPFEAVLGVVIVVVVIAAGLGLLVYLVRKK